ncbi:hypothetical protein [Altererythrobacter fulvus]|uniref:hypothetical protein n=1 Tax=Caenibius fulvus TaxID=2126012 RepID=UPI003019BC44
MAANQPKPSISAHRLFPAVVALWFATLFGLGLLVLPASALERIVGASGISAVLPSAAPPLGFTARLILSLTATILGGLAGYLAARLLAPRRPREEREPRVKVPPMQRKRMAQETGRRPLSAMEDLGPPIIAPMPSPEDVAPEEFLPQEIVEVEVAEAPAPAEYRPIPPFDYDVRAVPTEPDANDSPPEYEVEPEAEPAPFEEPALESVLSPEPEPAIEAEAEAEPEPEPEPEHLLHQAVPKRAVLPSDPDADLERMGTVQLAERLALAMQRHPGRPQSTPPAFLGELARQLAEPAPAAIPAAPAAAARPAGAIPTAKQAFAQPESHAAVEPLAAAERILGRASVAKAQEPDVDPAIPPMPAPALEAFGEEEYEYEEASFSSTALPLAGLSPAEGPIEDEAIEEEEDWDSGEQPERYSSLLAMRQPLREAVPADDEFFDEEDEYEEDDFVPGAFAEPQLPEMPAPMVRAPSGEVRPFDAPAEDAAPRVHPNRAETERVLRSALESIQRLNASRMSGAA